MLEEFSKDELLALDKFYSSSIGLRIQSKFPKFMGHMVEIQDFMKNDIIPKALEQAKQELKSRGIEINL